MGQESRLRTDLATVARRSRAVSVVALLALVACGGGTSDPDTSIEDGQAAGASSSGAPEGGTPDAPAVDESASLVQGAPAAVAAPLDDAGATDDAAALRRLESRVITLVIDARNHESWICSGEASRAEYRFTVDTDGARRGVELDGRGMPTSVTFGWAAIRADTLLLDYPDVGRQVELSSILFADDDAWRANDGAQGPLECRRQRYVDGEPVRDVAAVAAGDVDRDVEAAAALSGRIETRRDEEGRFDYWYCEIADGRPVGYVFAAEGVLDVERRAVGFDVVRVGADGAPGEGGDASPSRAPLDDATLAGGRAYLWLAADGTTLLLVPLEADVAGGSIETTSLEAIVFPVDDAFVARRSDGASLQCLRDGDG